MDNNQMEKIKCSNMYNCLFCIVFVADEARARVTVSAISFGIEFLQVQSHKKCVPSKRFRSANEWERAGIVCYNWGSKKKRRGRKLPLAALSLAKADCVMENGGHRWLHLNRSFFSFFKKARRFSFEELLNANPRLFVPRFALLPRSKAITSKQLSLKTT